jgi:3-oxoacyl-[acyl-carrier protein] reductase
MQMVEGRDGFSLEGRVAVVTGAASGIGLAAATAFAGAGAKLVMCDVDEDRLGKAAASVGPDVVHQVADVGQRVQVDALAERALSAFGRIDVWANVAGCVANCALIDATEELIDRVVAVNLKGVFWGCAAAGRAMKAQGSGVIINISSNGADTSPPGLSIYAMSKAGVNALTRSVARELGPFGVRANTVSPGFVETYMAQWSYRDADGRIDDDARSKVLAGCRASSPLGMIGEPGDIASAMLYLASDASRFVTGQNLRVNGGVSMF